VPKAVPSSNGSDIISLVPDKLVRGYDYLGLLEGVGNGRTAVRPYVFDMLVERVGFEGGGGEKELLR